MRWVQKSDDILANAVILVKQHSDYHVMMRIPLKDLYTHWNGPWNNTEMVVIEKEAYQFLAQCMIEAGEKIHDTSMIYQCWCGDCKNRMMQTTGLHA
jgi:hypothetical protein